MAPILFFANTARSLDRFVVCSLPSVVGIYSLLTRETIGGEDYTAASQYLEDFCKEAEFLYG